MEQMGQHNINSRETANNLDYVLEIVKKSEWRKSIAKATREYNLKIYNLNKLTPLRVKQLHTIINSKFYKNIKNKDYWNQNELRLFIWIAFVYGGAITKNPLIFRQQQWNTVSKCFADKTSFFCEFQFKCLKKVSLNSDKWVTEEEQLLKTIVLASNDDGPSQLKWNNIAKQFYISSNKQYFRTAKQCRQHWNTYLDPNKLKCPWSCEEDILLVKAVIDFGKKWSKISNILQDKRSEHNVKNRYNSLVSKYLKLKNLKDRKDYVQPEQLFQWLNDLEGEQQQQEPAKLQAISNVLSTPESKTKQDPQQQYHQEQFQKIQQRQQFIQFIPSAGHIIDTVQSPAMLISPLPLNFPSIVFSPVNIYYKNDMEVGFNLFSFQNLRQA